MTDAIKTPTDDDLRAEWAKHLSQIGGVLTFARAVLVRWGAAPTGGPAADRAFLERTLAAMEGVIDVADRQTVEFDALRSCVIDLTLMLFNAAPQPSVPVERPCHVFTVRKSGSLTEWEPTTMAFALPDGEHALYTAAQPAEPPRVPQPMPDLAALTERGATAWSGVDPQALREGRVQLTDEQIDTIAERMPGGIDGFLKGWGWRQFAREILALRSMPEWEPQFDCMTPEQEELAVQFCQEIAGPRGKPGSPPDPVRLLEMAEALYKAERAHGITHKEGGQDDAP